MVEVPAPTPVTTPVAANTLATPVLLLLQVPVPVASVSVVVAPTHTTIVPFTAPGSGLITTLAVPTQPEGMAYKMVTVPAISPETTPLEEPMLAVDGSLLLQVPPADASIKVVVEPTHALSTPVIGDIGLIVTVAVTKQPAAIV